VKYLNHSINNDELDELISWLEQPGNRKVFNDYAKINYSIDYKFSSYNTEKVKHDLLKKIKKDKKQFKIKRMVRYSKYAAILVIAIGIMFIYLTPSGTVPFNNNNAPSITLELENGESITLQEDATQKIVTAQGKIIRKQTKQGINYEHTELLKLQYNTLKIPFGKKFQLTLSDGSLVFLNAGSSIKFPVKFIPGKERKVYLTGEAFFDVSKNKDPFIVNTKNIDVEVLGTQFNVSAYPEDLSVNTVLVEGSVKLHSKDLKNGVSTLLTPKHEAIWDKNKKQILIVKANLTSSLAWMNGRLDFNQVAFKDIIKKLERSYNCKIINNNTKLDNEIFTATFNVEIESIEQVMNYISKNTPYTFTINKDNVIIIN